MRTELDRKSVCKKFLSRRWDKDNQGVGILVLLLLVDDLNPVFILLGGGRIAHCREMAVHCVMVGGRRDSGFDSNKSEV